MQERRALVRPLDRSDLPNLKVENSSKMMSSDRQIFEIILGHMTQLKFETKSKTLSVMHRVTSFTRKICSNAHLSQHWLLGIWSLRVGRRQRLVALAGLHVTVTESN